MSTYRNSGPIYLTQAQYDALSTKVEGQEYRIMGGVSLIPSGDTPSDFTTSTYVIKFVNGVATWVKES